jgi:hypothetical protein
VAVPALPLTGGCNCGGVRYEISEPLVSASYCHCKRCQRRSGAAASPQARVAPGAFRVLSGEELLREWNPGGESFAKVFCSVCGSSLWSRSPVDPQVISVRLGTFDDDPGIRPGHRQWLESAAPWEPVPDDGLERFARGRPH